MVQVVYRALLGPDLREALDCLQAAGLHPVVLDDTNPDPGLVHAARGTLRIRIAVPREEIPAAVRALGTVGRMPESTKKLARGFEIAALKFVLVGAALFGLTALAYEIEPDFPWQTPALALLGGWVVFLWIRAHVRDRP
ncbi:MAG: hypothetical protein ABFS86_10890 [Planctomycetota bacterium]